MPRHNLARTLVAVLAVSALAAPAAVARPADPVSPQARNAAATAKAQHAQDLRRLDAGNDIRTSPYPSGKSDPREAYYSSYGTSAKPYQPTPAVSSDDGTPWTTIALGLAGALLLIAAVLAIARRARPRAHATA
jgi:hypothetical protein